MEGRNIRLFRNVLVSYFLVTESLTNNASTVSLSASNEITAFSPMQRRSPVQEKLSTAPAFKLANFAIHLFLSIQANNYY